MKIPYKSHLVATSLLLLPCLNVFGQGDIVLTKIGQWNNVVDFSINRPETHIVMTQVDANGINSVVESYRVNGSWTQAEPIDVINDHAGGASTVGGVYLSDNETRLYFHANYPDGVGGFDIYFCDKTPDGWAAPQLLDSINTAADETYPSLIPGDEAIYFLHHQVSNDPKVEKREADRLSIYRAERRPNGKWRKPEPVNVSINTGYIYDVNVAADGETIFYTLSPEKKKGTFPMFTRRSISDTWLIPVDALNDGSGVPVYSVQAKGDKLYMVRSNNKKQMRQGMIVRADIADANMKPRKVVDEAGKILTLGSNQPVKADVTVYNPTTLAVLGRYSSDKWDGSFALAHQAKAQYIVDVRNPEYSFASYMLDYRKNDKPQLPSTIELFDTVRLSISVYDSEIFRPLPGKVIAVRTSDKTVFRSEQMAEGKFLFALPLGSDYNIIATSPNFVENKFLFKLEGDIVFSYFERNLPLQPKKREMEISVVDAQTKEPVAAQIVLDNQNREERISTKPTDMANGKVKVSLRDGDLYDMTVGGVQGYAFHNRMVDLKTNTSNQLTVELIALKKDASVRLNNIGFATASADIMPDSYAELDRVVQLLKENPGLKIEIAAHTDNVGNSAYNLMLSDRRAQSVVNYLVESGISADLLSPKGYGLTKPLVPNTSDENRALNRRVEFIILGTDE